MTKQRSAEVIKNHILGKGDYEDWFYTVKQSPRGASVTDVEDLCDRIEYLEKLVKIYQESTGVPANATS
jgi:hypothetical protein